MIAERHNGPQRDLRANKLENRRLHIRRTFQLALVAGGVL